MLPNPLPRTTTNPLSVLISSFCCSVPFPCLPMMFSPMANTRAAQQKRSRRVPNPHPPRHYQQRRTYQPVNRDPPLFPASPALPNELIERVLSFLPIKQSVQASTVAKRYQRSWSLCRNLVFDMNSPIFRTHNLVRVIDRVLESHTGPEIKNLTLILDPYRVQSWKIENWIRLCIQKGLENLDLSFFNSSFRLGVEILEIPTLRTLKLQNCTIQQLPENNNLENALKRLSSIVLRKVELEDSVLQHLVFYCKMLSYLEIVACTGFENVFLYTKEHRNFRTVKIGECPDIKRIAIDAPTLKSFFYKGVVPIIRVIGDAPLKEAYFRFVPPRTYFIQPLTMEILAADLFHVSVLTISAPFIEALATRIRGVFYEDAMFALNNLKELQLLMEGGAFCNPFDIAMFLKHCPNLEKLYIDMNGYYFDSGAYWEMHQKPYLRMLDEHLSGLKVVTLMGYKFMGPEIDLAKIILKNSPMLETLFLATPRNGRRQWPRDIDRYCHLFRSWKLSPAAKIVLLHHRSAADTDLVPTHNNISF